MIDSILRGLGFFDTYGLKYSTGHLKKMQSTIAGLSIETQAEYVDRVTKKAIDTGKDVNTLVNPRVIDANPETYHQSGWNTTSIGNLAYVALYHPNQWYRDRARRCLDNLKSSSGTSNYIKSQPS